MGEDLSTQPADGLAVRVDMTNETPRREHVMTSGRFGPVPLPRQPGENDGLWTLTPRERPFEYRLVTERIRVLWEDTWIERPSARHLSKEIIAHLATDFHRAGRGAFLIATGRAGTTSLLQDLARDHREVRGTGIALAEMPDTVDPLDLYVELRRAIEGVGRERAPLHVLDQRCLAEIDRSDVVAIAVDGMEHLLHVSPRRRQIILEMLRDLGRRGDVHLILAMSPRLAAKVGKLYNGDRYDQNKRLERLKPFREFRLKPFRIDDEYVGLLDIWDRSLPLAEASNLAGRELALHLYSLCDGSYGRLASMLRRAAAEAITSGTERITIELLDEMGLRPPVTFSGFRF